MSETPPPQPVEEKKEVKEKPPKREKVKVKVWTLYRVEGDSATRLRRECPRCGKGYFMGEHADRFTCGNCGYTTFKK